MNPNLIDFKKERDLGAIISDTFKFIRENGKIYFETLLKIVGPFLVLGVGAILFYMFSLSGLFSNLDETNNNPFDFLSQLFSMFFVIMLVYVFLYTLLSMATLYFIKSYIENKGKPNFNYIKSELIANIWKFIGLGVLVTLVTVVGFVFCYLPGFYLGTVLSLATSIMVFEKKSVGDTFSHCFTLISGQWWNTFGTLFVVWFIMLILGQAFAVPALIYDFVKTGTSLIEQEPGNAFEIFKDPIYLALNALSYIFQFILYSVPLISTAFIYFDLNEQKYQTGTFEKIDSLGSTNNNQ